MTVSKLYTRDCGAVTVMVCVVGVITAAEQNVDGGGE